MVSFNLTQQLNEAQSSSPDIIIEIVSPGSENQRRDRVVKKQLYARFGVREYWIADPESKTIEIITSNAEVAADSVIFYADDEINSTVLPEFRFKVSRIFPS